MSGEGAGSGCRFEVGAVVGGPWSCRDYKMPRRRTTRRKRSSRGEKREPEVGGGGREGGGGPRVGGGGQEEELERKIDAIGECPRSPK